MKHIVVLTGAGISAESGIKTFRDAGGMWEEYDIMDVASIDGWFKNPALVLDFYNKRRADLEHAQPNKAHLLLAQLEQHAKVSIITQNVDNLHERAGSFSVLHLHGELTKVRSTANDFDVQDIGYAPIHMGNVCKQGYQLRPHIVWFGEAVPLIQDAAEITSRADVLIIIGTSMQVYPAAGLLHYAQASTPIFFIDPNPAIESTKQITVIAEQASSGMQKVFDVLVQQ